MYDKNRNKHTSCIPHISKLWPRQDLLSIIAWTKPTGWQITRNSIKKQNKTRSMAEHLLPHKVVFGENKNKICLSTWAARRSPKCIRKSSARRIQKNLRSIIWYSCCELFKTGKFRIFLVSFMILALCPEWSRFFFATRYKIFSNITHQPTLSFKYQCK